MNKSQPASRIPPSTARITALLILNSVEQKQLPLDRILDDVLGSESSFSRRDRALANALVYGVLRWRGRLDYIIGKFSKTPIQKIQPEILNILRLGLFQIIYLSKIPVSAAVNTSVEMAKALAPAWVVRYVNGLLRSASRAYTDVVFPDAKKDPVGNLCASKSFPPWLISKWLSRFGVSETMDLCDAINIIPSICLRTNTIKASREELFQSLKSDVETISYTPHSIWGIHITNPAKAIPEFKSFQEGWFQVQDEAAQLIAPFLAPQPGDTVLDACAGLGGKTGHIAQMMENRGSIIAMDRDGDKLLKLERDMKRLGISIATPLTHDLSHPIEPEWHNKFDRVLLDAPCSGLGVLRRNPDAKWSIIKKDLNRYKQRQQDFLGTLSFTVKPGGVLVYTVCSMEPEETETVIQHFLHRHPDFKLKNGPEVFPMNDSRPLIDSNGCLRTFPHWHHMDGFFAAIFQREMLIPMP